MNNLKQYFENQLITQFPQSEINEIYLLAAENVFGLPRTEILLNKNTKITENQTKKFENIVARLKTGEPIQYILGEAWFYGLKLIVNNSVLIPRPETEELVEWILSDNQQNAEILDIGTGSGCIAIALAKNNANFRVSALDISDEALKVAKKNTELQNVDIQFIKGDILKIPVFEQKFDIIVSNPPYIPENELINIEQTVKDFEPHIALFAPQNNPLIFYEKIAQFTKNQLNTNGKLYFEIQRDYSTQVVKLLNSMNFNNIEVRKDISGNERMVKYCI